MVRHLYSCMSVVVASVLGVSVNGASGQQQNVIYHWCISEAIRSCIEAHTASQAPLFDRNGNMFYVEEHTLKKLTDATTMPFKVVPTYTARDATYAETILTTGGIEVGFEKVDAANRPYSFACRIGYVLRDGYISPFHILGANQGDKRDHWPNGFPCVRGTTRGSPIFSRIHDNCKIHVEYLALANCTSPGPSPQEVWNFMSKHYFESLKTVVEELKK